MSDKKRILVIRFSSMGDVILTTPLFPNLKEKWPDSDVVVLTKRAYAPLFDGNPYVDHVRVYDPQVQPFSKLTKEIREDKFDVVIDLQHSLRSWFLRFMSAAPIAVSVAKATLARRHLIWWKRVSKGLSKSFRERVLGCLSPLDIKVNHAETQLFPQNINQVLKTFSLDSTASLIGLAPGAKRNTKRWSAEKFAEVANELGKIPGTEIILLGDKTDKEFTGQVFRSITVPCRDFVGWTSIPELISIVSRLRFLITNDSGILHIGEALNRPLVALFGPTVKALGFAPYRDTSRVVEVDGLQCRPCSLHGDDKCPISHHKCMEEINVSQVLTEARRLLDMPVASQVSSGGGV